jgi:hypothetical protein
MKVFILDRLQTVAIESNTERSFKLNPEGVKLRHNYRFKIPVEHKAKGVNTLGRFITELLTKH